MGGLETLSFIGAQHRDFPFAPHRTAGSGSPAGLFLRDFICDPDTASFFLFSIQRSGVSFPFILLLYAATLERERGNLAAKSARLFIIFLSFFFVTR